jgi:hypothetical protein
MHKALAIDRCESGWTIRGQPVKSGASEAAEVERLEAVAFLFLSKSGRVAQIMSEPWYRQQKFLAEATDREGQSFLLKLWKLSSNCPKKIFGGKGEALRFRSLSQGSIGL